MNAGTVVGDYTILETLGAGRVTAVYAARHEALGTEHVLRVLLPEWAADPERRQRFLELGRAQGSFRHAGLARVTDALEIDGMPVLVQDRLDGVPLRKRLVDEGRLAPKEATQITIAVLQALAASGMVHGRITPEAVFLERDGGVRLLGFGQSLPGVDPPVRNVAGLHYAYAAPEIVEGKPPTERTDVFAVGVVLWEMLAGTAPFRANTTFAALQAALTERAGSPDRHGDLPGWLGAIVQAALCPDPVGRLSSAQPFLDALIAGPRGADLPTAPATRDPASPNNPFTPEARNFVLTVVGLLGGAMVVGMVLVGLFGVLVYLYRPPEVHSVQVASDACGLTTITADVTGDGFVEIRVDGTLLSTEVAQGRTTVTRTTQLTQGKQALIEVFAGNDAESESHTVTGEPLSMRFEVLGQPRQGVIGNTRVHVAGSCIPDDLTWAAQVEGTRTQGKLAGPIELDTTAFAEGRHTVTVDLLRANEIVHTASSTVLVGEAPPPNDLDLGGHEKDVDCNDLDPAVNPGEPEQPLPNGIDDNCDGRIDEGTVAYDDDGDGMSEQDGDCNDADRTVRPGLPEKADCRDQNCDGKIDEGVSLPKVDDGYEPNGTQATAHDLRTSTLRSFVRDLDLVASSTDDEAWFEFYSQDGDFDDWGIDVRITELPANSSVLLEVYDAGGAPRASLVVTQPTEELQVRGRAFRDDSGDYTLVVRPRTLYADWCPLKVHVVAR